MHVRKLFLHTFLSPGFPVPGFPAFLGSDELLGRNVSPLVYQPPSPNPVTTTSPLQFQGSRYAPFDADRHAAPGLASANSWRFGFYSDGQGRCVA
jgi:hypothetical protein